MTSNFLSALGLTTFTYILHAMWKHHGNTDGPFVSLHTSQDSVKLAKEGNDPESSLIQLIRDKVPAFGPNAKFDGVWWLPGGDAQTVYCSLGDFSKVDPIVYERIFLQLPDQGVIAVDVTPPLSSHPVSNAENILLVAHGLTGGSHEAYVRAVLARVTPSKQSGGLGFRAIVVNFRGCNGSPVITPRLYHAGSSDDIKHVVLWICHTFSACRIYGLGFSLGANILTKYAGEEGESCPLQGLVTLANPWDFIQSSLDLPKTFLGRHIYRFVLGGALRALLHLHRRAFLDASELPISHSILEDIFQQRKLSLKTYDELFTAPMWGFEDATAYYREISSSRHVKSVKIPCLAINSMDDPITGSNVFPFEQASRNPYLVLALTKAGGHLGWFERTPKGGVGRWYVKPVEQFLSALVEYGLPERQKPSIARLGTDFVRQEGCEGVGFRVLSREQSDLIVSGTQESRLFTGW